MGLLRGITSEIDCIAISCKVCWGVNDAMVLSICHKRVAVSFFIGEKYLTLSQIPAICTICSICILMYNMHKMFLLFTESGKGLDIHLILWWIPSAQEEYVIHVVVEFRHMILHLGLVKCLHFHRQIVHILESNCQTQTIRTICRICKIWLI